MTNQTSNAVSKLLSTPAGVRLLADAQREEATERLARRKAIRAALDKASALADAEGAAAERKRAAAEARLVEARAAATAAEEALCVATAVTSGLGDRHRRLREAAERELAALAPPEVAAADRAVDALLADWRAKTQATMRGEDIVAAERAAREELQRLALSCDPPEQVVAAAQAAVRRLADLLAEPEPPMPKTLRPARAWWDIGPDVAEWRGR